MKQLLTLLITYFMGVSLVAQEATLKLKVGQEVKTASGLAIKLTNSGRGKTVDKGDKVKVHYTGTLVDGRKFDSSKDREQPFEFVIGMKQVIAGWDEAFALLKVGDKAILTIPPDLGYAETPMPKIPVGSILIFDVEVLDVYKNFAPKQFVVKPKDIKSTQSGLKYCVIDSGAGLKAEKGKTVEVHYTGFFENGDIFDSSVLRGQPISFRVGAGMVIPGWDEGLEFLKAGGKALLMIPYPLAYGDSGRPPLIPPMANLIFNVELVSVK